MWATPSRRQAITANPQVHLGDPSGKQANLKAPGMLVWGRAEGGQGAYLQTAQELVEVHDALCHLLQEERKMTLSGAWLTATGPGRQRGLVQPGPVL